MRSYAGTLPRQRLAAIGLARTTPDVALLFVAALALRALAAWLVPWPPYLDASYYTVVAQNLAAGNGFNVPVIWAYLDVGSRIPADASLPIPSNSHWPPLGPIVAAAGMVLLGPTWSAGTVPMVIIGAALPPLTYLAARELFERRWIALAAAALALFPGPLFILYPAIDNFAVFGVTGTAVLYASARAVRSDRPGRWLAVAGAATGLAALARIDGVLLAVAPATAWLIGRGWTPWDRRGARPSWAAGIASAAAFLVVVAPWLLRNLAVFGTALPSAGGHTLWITSYNEQFSIGHEVSLATYLDWGWANIIGSKLSSWATIAGRTMVLMGGFLVLPFVGGLIAFRRKPELAPFTVYFVVLFALMGGAFTFHAPQGAWYHSAPAWLAFAYPVAIAGIAPTFGWLGRWWRLLGRPPTHRLLAVVGVVAAIVLSATGSMSLYSGWVGMRERDTTAAQFFVEGGHTTDVVMYRDAAALHLLSGNPAVAIPYDPYPVIEQAGRAYGVRWLVISRLPEETRAPLGLWDGGRAVDAHGNRADWLANDPAFETDTVRVFEVLSAGD
jgi:4-amino-4-deoxy-L-arabinose transferase-like glycosyltransferase